MDEGRDMGAPGAAGGGELSPRQLFARSEARRVAQAVPATFLSGGAVLFLGEFPLRLAVLKDLGLTAFIPGAVGLGICLLCAYLVLRSQRPLVVAFSFVTVSATLVLALCLSSGLHPPSGPFTMLAGMPLLILHLSLLTPYPWLLPIIGPLAVGLSLTLSPILLSGAVEPAVFLRWSIVCFAMGGGVSTNLWFGRRKRAGLEAALARQANIDALTQLSNRQHTLSQGNAQLKRARREGLPFSMILMDLDHFKAVNDTYGHAVGDQALEVFAETLREVARPFDIVGRVGGEEFLWILPDTTQSQALAFGERLAQALRSRTISGAGAPLRITFSGGVAQVGAAPERLERALRRADRALYRAKQRGRDRLAKAPMGSLRGDEEGDAVLREDGIPLDPEALQVSFERSLTQRSLVLVRWVLAVSVVNNGGMFLYGLLRGRAATPGEGDLPQLALYGLMLAWMFTPTARRHLAASLFFVTLGLALQLQSFLNVPGDSQPIIWMMLSLVGFQLIGPMAPGGSMGLAYGLAQALAVGSVLILDAPLPLPGGLCLLYTGGSLLTWGILSRWSYAEAKEAHGLSYALKGRATTDALTGLLNRAEVLRAGAGELLRQRGAERPRPIAVILLDIDHFKRVNDTWGHAVGDEILRVVSDRIRGAGRVSDLIGRFGGEEILCILPACDIMGARIVAERMRRAIGDVPISTEGWRIPTTASVGVAVLRPGEPLDSAIARADGALYRAKAGGRDRVETCEEAPLPGERLPAGAWPRDVDVSLTSPPA